MSAKITELKKRYKASLDHEYRDQHEKVAQMCNKTALEVIDVLMEEIDELRGELAKFEANQD